MVKPWLRFFDSSLHPTCTQRTFRTPRSRFVMMLLILTLSLFVNETVKAQNPPNGKVVLQAFWWDYWNNNYPNGWFNYLADLAPRLRSMGIDAVWIPPTSKSNGSSGVGYSPFDHYDLGDKWQKNTLRTRCGTKDEYLRMVAIMHANGIDVIQDIVPNHVDNAGSATGAGGQDPAAWEDWTTSKFKNFRYVSWTRPASDETAANYLARNGRFPKNWQNFHPNPGRNSISGDWAAVFWGPDISYVSGAFGQSSNATFNPAQSSNYMRNEMRRWFVWLKKQTGIDGYRFDAVKHFEPDVVEDLLWNAQSNAGWANGGTNMWAVGEWVGGASELDNWCNAVQNRAGTFDFALRQGIFDMVNGNGFYDLGRIPGTQQSNRQRTVPFVNNHDTFRPIVDANGNYTGWRTGDQLAPNIDPFNPRLAAAYAIACAVDGSPQIFFEDLFDVGGTGRRYSHLPTSTTDLPVRSDIANIIWCHQTLNFKQGAYRVRWQAQDLLIIERSARAIIAVNDNGSNWQGAWVTVDFAPGTVLKDYSGANSGTITVPGDRRVNIWAPPTNGSAARRGYSIWGPIGFDNNQFNPAIRSTTQEWELDDDLGDSHANSLRQGGALPANSTALRTAGRIFAEAGRQIRVEFYPSVTTRSHTVNLQNASATIVATTANSGNLVLTHTPATTGWYTIRVRHTSSSSAPTERVWVKATYTPPRVINARTTLAPAPFTDEMNDEAVSEEAIVESPRDVNVPSQTELLPAYPNPFNPSTTIRFSIAKTAPVRVSIFNALGQQVSTIVNENLTPGNYTRNFNATGLPSGIYFVRLEAVGVAQTQKISLVK